MAQKMRMLHSMGSFPIVEKLKKRTNGIVPPNFYRELEEYCHRNAITLEVYQYGEKKTVKKICLQCLKAFMLEQATQHYMSFEIIQLASKINAKTGHSNYYLDQGNLKSLDAFL